MGVSAEEVIGMGSRRVQEDWPHRMDAIILRRRTSITRPRACPTPRSLGIRLYLFSRVMCRVATSQLLGMSFAW